MKKIKIFLIIFCLITIFLLSFALFGCTPQNSVREYNPYDDKLPKHYIQASQSYDEFLRENPNKAVKYHAVDNGDSITYVYEVVDK